MNQMRLTPTPKQLFFVVGEHLYSASDKNNTSFRALYLISAVHGKIITAPYNYKNLKRRSLAMSNQDALKVAATMMQLDTIVRCELVKFNP